MKWVCILNTILAAGVRRPILCSRQVRASLRRLLRSEAVRDSLRRLLQFGRARAASPRFLRSGLIGMVFALGPPLSGEETSASPAEATSHYLFHPTPAGSLREMTTDRPDKTESPYTLDAGHFQFEMDLVNYTHDHDRSNGADAQTDAFAFGPVNLKVGLLDRIDFQ